MTGYGPAPGAMQQAYKFPSMTSVNTMASLGYLPPGHGYVPKKEKPEKPYGLTFTALMNRTHRGPGRKHLRYALAAALTALLLFSGAALYLGHRNVSRMIVYRTEVLGALLVAGGVLCVYLTARCVWAAREQSNRWRAGVRFRPEGLTTAAAYNEAYVPEGVHGEKLSSGTYGPKAVKEIPKPRRGGKPRSRARSKENLDQAGPPARPRGPHDEADQGRPFTVEAAPPAGPYPPRGPLRGFPPGAAPRGPPPAGFRPRGPPPLGWRGPPPSGFSHRGPPPPGWRGPPPRGGIPPQPQRTPPLGPGPHELQSEAPGGPPRPYLTVGGLPPKDSESEL